MQLNYVYTGGCASPTPTTTATSTPTATATATATFTPTPTATATFTPTPAATATFTPTPTPTPTCPTNYNYTITTGSYLAGTTSLGINCDDCSLSVPFPFPVKIYDTTYNSALAGSNGELGFGTDYAGFGITCMPNSIATYTIGPMWVDQYPVTATCPTCGVFYATYGTAPNRTFVIEWRDAYYPGNPTPNLNYEVIFNEATALTGRFDVYYNLVTSHAGGTDSALTVGVQQNTTNFTQVGCDATGTNPPAGVATGAYFIYTLAPCASPTPTATAGTPSPTPTCTPGGTPGPWTIVAPYPLIVESAAVTSNGTFGYSAGGFAGSPTNAVYRYDPVANTWTALANVTTGFYDAAIAYAANTNKIYVFGGLDPSFNVLTTTQIYDVATNSWTMGAPMPDPTGRYFSSAVYDSVNGKIYVFGGFDGATFSEQSQTWEYDPVANTWNTSRAPIPVAMGGAGYSIVGQFAYLAGHWNGGAASTDHYRYDIVADSWTAVAPVPVAMYRPAAAGVGTQEFLVGGGNPDISASATQRERVAASMRAPATSYTSTYIYDTTSNSWTSGPNTNVPHSFTGGTAIGNLLLVVGGFDGVSGDTNVVESSVVTGGCPSPTPTGTPSATPTASPSATPTPTASPSATPTPTVIPSATPTASPTCTPAQITTLFASNNSGSPGGANYFDLTVAANPITVTALDINTSATVAFSNVRVYVLPGMTSVGNETNMALWTQVATGSGTGAGQDVPTHVTLSNPFVLNAGTLYGIAVVADPAIALFYTNGNGSNQNYSNADLSLVLGSATNVPFTAPVFSPRVWNGTIYYTGGPCGPTPTPTATPSATPTCTAGGTPGPWTQAAPVAIDHYGGFMDSDGTFAYEGGGYSFSAADNINQFGKFDPVANTWTPLAPVPDLNNGMASGVYAPNVNKLFVFGGSEFTTATVVNTTRIYDIATNTWSTGANMPDVRAFMASGYFNGKIYLVGGYSTGNITPAFLQTWEYDPVANTFNTSRMSIPAAAGFGGAASGVINGHLYVAGGRDANNTVIATTWDYNIATDTWTARANMPSADNVPGSAVIGGKLWVFGGGNPFSGSAASPKSANKGLRAWFNRLLRPDTTDALLLYDPATDTWSSGPSLIQQRAFPAGTHVGNTAVAVGGYTGASTTTSVEINVTGGGCPSPTPTATPTGTPSATPTCGPAAWQSGPRPASGPLCHPGRPRHGQHALHRRRPDRRRGADPLRPGLAL